MSKRIKARLSSLTAFSFGISLKYRINDHRIPLLELKSMVFRVCFTSQNETSKTSLNPIIKSSCEILSYHASPEGGIVLFRLLVAV